MKKDTIIIDIDGVIADYRLGLLYWIRQSCPSLAQKANEHLRKSDTWIDADSMGVSYYDWLGVLEMFRMSGGKQSIPVVDGAKDLMYFCKSKGWDIVLLTSRPIDIYSNIYRDTVEWLRNNALPYDMLLWSKGKAEMVFKMRLVHRTIFAIDDEFKHIEDYDKLGIDTVWLDLYDINSSLNDKYEVMRGSRFTSLMEFVRKGKISI